MAQTFTQFRNSYQPRYEVWASVPGNPGAVRTPGDAKIRQGWTIEKPSHSTMNFWQNQTDKRLEELEAKVAWLIANLGYTL